MEKIQEFINRAEKLYDSGVNEPKFKAWKSDVVKFLSKAYGNNSNQVAIFNNIEYYNYYLTYDVFNGGWKKNILKEGETFKKGIKTAIFYLKNYESNDNFIDSIIDKTINIDEDEEESVSKTGKRTKNKSAKGIANKKAKNKNVFIVNGRTVKSKAKVENYLLELGIKPIILNVDENEIKMSTNSNDTYFKIDQDGKWQTDFAKKLKAMKLDIKKKKSPST